MVGEQSYMEQDILDSESLIREYKEKIQRVLEKESNLLKEKAERDASEVLARAKKEADKILAQARQKANIESEQITTRAKEEAEQITLESHEQSARVFDETRKKLADIITKVLEHSATNTQNEISRAASDARTRTSHLMNQVNQNLEKIIDETVICIRAEFERLAAAITEVETGLSTLKELRVKEVSEKPQISNRPELTPITPASKKTVSVVPSFENEPDPPVKESGDSRFFEGSVTLEIVSPFGQEHQGDLPELLNRVRGLKVNSAGSYTRADRRINKYTVDLRKPIPLLKILNGMPQVKDVSEHKEKIEVTLR